MTISWYRFDISSYCPGKWLALLFYRKNNNIALIDRLYLKAYRKVHRQGSVASYHRIKLMLLSPSTIATELLHLVEVTCNLVLWIRPVEARKNETKGLSSSLSMYQFSSEAKLPNSQLGVSKPRSLSNCRKSKP